MNIYFIYILTQARTSQLSLLMLLSDKRKCGAILVKHLGPMVSVHCHIILGTSGNQIDPLKELSPNLIVDDLIKLLQATTPKRPVLVGLSIGGLFRCAGIQNGVQAAGLVLTNTLRKPGLRLDWINESTHRAFKAGDGNYCWT